jgi:hypothetical protein
MTRVGSQRNTQKNVIIMELVWETCHLPSGNLSRYEVNDQKYITLVMTASLDSHTIYYSPITLLFCDSATLYSELLT